jgi:UDP-N-acetylmuramoyl-L-alanyl-D-glutamate--2,6-diaminopimelate ligase
VLLAQVVSKLDVVETVGPADVEITGVTHDSHRVNAGALFCCLPGSVTDGHDFAPQAIADGAVALLCQRALDVAVPQVVVSDARRSMAVAAATFWDWPARSMRMVGVTGTNGKTTTVSLVAAMLDAAGMRAEPIGTLQGARTTPESTDLQAQLAGLRDEGYAAVAMEVSSHALVAARVDAITYDVAAFTNLSHEHLDFHHTMDEYFAAKAELFTPERARRAVVCVDDEWGARLAGLAADRGVDVIRCSFRDVVIDSIDGSTTSFRWHGATGRLHLAGMHNVANAVIAANVGEALGLSASQALDGIASLDVVSGRFEYVRRGQPFHVVVDYAHTPGALQVALDAARSVVNGDGQVTVVVGCGGEKDRAKRPLMASVCEELADHVVLTSDNPRHEDPRAILDEMRAGLRDPEGVIIDADRTSAIRRALASAKAGDLVLIAGKGHETTQTIGDEAFPFDDRVVAAEVLRELGFDG